MTYRDDAAQFVDMLIAAREAQALTGDTTWEEYLGDRMLQLALQKLVENIGEAASRLTPEGRSSLPGLPWKDMVGMRNRLVHDYMRVELGRVWDVVQTDLAPLIVALEAVVPPDAN